MTAQQRYAIEAFYGRTYYRPGGMGVTTQQITSTAGGGLMTAGGVIAAIPGGQLPGAVIAAVGALTGLIGGLFKPDLTKVEATHIVDAVEAQGLRPTLNAWRALPAEKKTASMQAGFLQTIDGWLSKVQQGCSNPALGTAGEHCISERLIHGGTAPWCPTGSGCDWITLYRDPIANDPEVHADAAPESPVGSAISNFFGGGDNGAAAGLPLLLLLGGALILIGLSSD
jgi:hypothetical protein